MSSKLDSFGPIRGLVILGGGELVGEIVKLAEQISLPIKVITSPRTNFGFDNCPKEEILVVDKLSERELEPFLKNTQQFLFLSIGAPWIFSRDLIQNFFFNRLLNLHGARLPQNRGGGGFSWQILSGVKYGFCLIHKVDEGVDTGDIVDFEEFIYPATARIPQDYREIYLQKNVKFISNFISKFRFEKKALETIAQPEYLSTYWPRLNTPIHGYIDWNWPAAEIEKFICAFDDPYVGASSFWNSTEVRIKQVSMTTGDGTFHQFQNGLVFRKGPEWICVALNSHTLIIEKILDTTGESVLAKIKIGDRLWTPNSKLQDAMLRVTYSPTGIQLPKV